MGNNIIKRVMKLEKEQNLLVTPMAVVFQWPGETPEVAWQRHLELRPKDEFAFYRAYIKVKGSRKKGEARFYGYPVTYEYPEQEGLNFEYHEIRKGFMDLMVRTRELMKAGDTKALQVFKTFG
jgi:hypothetical protein